MRQLERIVGIAVAVVTLGAVIFSWGEMHAQLVSLRAEVSAIQARLEKRADSMEYAQQAWDEALWGEMHCAPSH